MSDETAHCWRCPWTGGPDFTRCAGHGTHVVLIRCGERFVRETSYMCHAHAAYVLRRNSLLMIAHDYEFVLVPIEAWERYADRVS